MELRQSENFWRPGTNRMIGFRQRSKMQFAFVVTIALFGSLAATSPATGDTHIPIDSADARLTVGKIANASTKHFNRLGLLANHLAQAMGSQGIRNGDVLIANSVREMNEHLLAGRVDVLSETPFGALRLIDKGNAELLLVEWKRGRPSYRSVFFVRRSSRINAITDLAGSRIAFEDPNSTSAFFLPLAELLRHGIGATHLDAPDAPPVTGKIGYLFAHQEIGQAVMVANGLADAGVFSDSDWSKLSQMDNGIANGLRVIHRTEEVFRSAVLIRRSMSAASKARLKEILLEMPATDAGRKVLASYYGVTNFEEPSGAPQRSVARARKLFRLFQEAN